MTNQDRQRSVQDKGAQNAVLSLEGRNVVKRADPVKGHVVKAMSDDARRRFIERARDEIPALREQVATSLAGLREIAGR
ncbi:MAG TPA: hypothetical protein VK272_12130 [Solirubrobacteraceae bacterium]|nr:hypothetical protein [Solirubrobacteraceae bacterium]